jgi:hypothetical protein
MSGLTRRLTIACLGSILANLIGRWRTTNGMRLRLICFAGLGILPA